MGTIITEAKATKAPIAAHASSPEAVITAANAGVTSIEHGVEPSDDALKAMKQNGTMFVLKLAVMELLYHGGTCEEVLAHTMKVFDVGIKIACGVTRELSTAETTQERWS